MKASFKALRIEYRETRMDAMWMSFEASCGETPHRETPNKPLTVAVANPLPAFRLLQPSGTDCKSAKTSE